MNRQLKLTGGGQFAWNIFLVICFSALLNGCVSVPQQDTDFEKAAFQFSEELDLFLLTAASKSQPIPYSSVVEQYNQLEKSLNTLLKRSRIITSNEKVTAILKQIQDGFDDMRALHKEEGTVTPSYMDGEQVAFDNLFTRFFIAYGALPKAS
jgi:hypothetical protein